MRVVKSGNTPPLGGEEIRPHLSRRESFTQLSVNYVAPMPGTGAYLKKIKNT